MRGIALSGSPPPSLIHSTNASQFCQHATKHSVTNGSHSPVHIHYIVPTSLCLRLRLRYPAIQTKGHASLSSPQQIATHRLYGYTLARAEILPLNRTGCYYYNHGSPRESTKDVASFNSPWTVAHRGCDNNIGQRLLPTKSFRQNTVPKTDTRAIALLALGEITTLRFAGATTTTVNK